MTQHTTHTMTNSDRIVEIGTGKSSLAAEMVKDLSAYNTRMKDIHDKE